MDHHLPTNPVRLDEEALFYLAQKTFPFATISHRACKRPEGCLTIIYQVASKETLYAAISSSRPLHRITNPNVYDASAYTSTLY